LSHNSWPIDRVAKLTLIVTGTSRNATVDIPEIQDIKLHSRGQSSQISMVNSSVTSSISYNYLVQGLRPGNYTIPAISIKSGGESAVTTPISFQITGSGDEKSPTEKEKRTLEDIAFFKVSEIEDHYPGEIVPITLKLYLDREYRVDISSLPVLSGDGVVMEQLSTEPAQSQELYKGRNYHVIAWETTLAGIKTGTHPIAFSLQASLLIPQQRRSRSPFSSFGGSLLDDSLFNDFFGNYERRPITVSSPELPFSVLALPEALRPEGFTGAIGNFDISVTANPTDIEIGEPITLITTIEGEGNFDRVEAPLFPEDKGWKTYSPTSGFADGKKTFEQAVVIKSRGKTEIPSLQFSYFDPEQKKYITKSSRPIALKVHGEPVANSTQPSPVQSLPKQKTLLGNDQEIPLQLRIEGLVPQYLETGIFTTHLLPLFKNGWYISSGSLLLLLSIIIALLKHRQQKLKNNPGLQQSKFKKIRLQKDLALIEEAIAGKDTAGFLQECRSAIQNQLGELCAVEPSAVSLADINKAVAPDSPLLHIFTLAEEAVYGGARLSAGDMDKLYDRLKIELEVIG